MRFLFFILMIFATPVPFAEALQSLEVKSALPTSLTSAELEKISAEILERALFSARTTSAEYLQEIEDVIDAMVRGEIDLATARLQLKDKLAELGYESDAGLAPEEVGTLKDLASEARINLVIETNAAMAQGYGNWLQGQAPAILDQWPAQELYRAYARKVPRNWRARWAQAGGSEPDGRMIALKNADIWKRISRFSTPYPPFDFNSGMSIRDVDRDAAVKAGLIDRDTQIAPQDRGFNDDLQFTPGVRSAALRTALEEEGYSFNGEVLSL